MTTTINPYLRLLYYYDIDSEAYIYKCNNNKKNEEEVGTHFLRQFNG